MITHSRVISGKLLRNAVAYPPVFLGQRGMKFKAQLPSETTTVLLRHLPLSATQASLSDAVKDVGSKKVEIEPGCLVHTTNVAEANFIQSKLQSTMGYKGHIAAAALPSLVLDNLPTNISIEELKRTFGKFDLKDIRLIGQISVQVEVHGAETALRAARLLEASNLDGARNLSVHISQVSGNHFVLSATNFPEAVATGAKAEEIVKTVLKSAGDDALATTRVDHAPPALTTAELRFSSATTESQLDEVKAKLATSKFIGELTPLSRRDKPCLLFRKVPGARKGGVKALLEQYGCLTDVSRILVSERGKPHEIGADVTAVYFRSREAALKTLQTVHGKQGYSSAIYVKYTEQCEPSVLVEGVPDELYSESALLELFKDCKPAYVELTEDSAAAVLANDSSGRSGRRAVVVLTKEEFADAAVSSVNHKVLPDGSVLKVSPHTSQDFAFEVSLAGPDRSISVQSLKSSLEGLGLGSAISQIVVNSNVSAHLMFMTTSEVGAARALFVQNQAKLTWRDAAGITARIATTPSVSVEVEGLPQTESAASVATLLGWSPNGSACDPSLIRLLGIDRSAILKFRKHAQVVPAIKQLKSITYDGARMHPQKFRSTKAADSNRARHPRLKEYNEQGVLDIFDRNMFRHAMKDFLYADPATRYEMARNAFEVELGKTEFNPSRLLHHDASKAEKDLAKELLKSEPSPERNQRLFELFLKRHDIMDYTNDFDEFTAFLGKADESDAYNWSQFRVEVQEDEDKYFADLERERAQRKSAKMRQRFNWKQWEIVSPEERERRLLDNVSQSDAMDAELRGAQWESVSESVIKTANGKRKSRTDDDVGIRLDSITFDPDLNAGLRPRSDVPEEVWAAPGADESKYSVRLENGKFASVENRVSPANAKPAAEGVSFIPLKSYIFNKDLFLDNEEVEFYGYDLDDEEVRRRLLRMKAVEALIQREQNESDAGYARRQEEAFEKAKALATSGNLSDRHANIWMGTILDTDSVQKTEAQGRVATFRALVAVGNMRGSGGYGMGKGESADHAIFAAYKDAMRHVKHYDLYDNYGIAHNLMAKHNSCIVKMRTVPKGRRMIASPMVRAILQNMGIASTSVTVIGRRNPYAVVKAIFRALDKHVNLDEYAKTRGLRYLTVKAMYEIEGW